MLDLLHAFARSPAGAVPVATAIAEVTAAARAVLDFERVALLCPEGDDALRVRVEAPQPTEAGAPGRFLRRNGSSQRLWSDLQQSGRLGDAAAALDPAFPIDREILAQGTRSMLRARLEGRAGWLGTLLFSHSRINAFDDEDEPTAAAFAGLVAMTLEHERLLADELRRQRRLAALDVVLPQLEDLQDLDDIAVTVSRLAKGIVDHDAAGVLVLHSGGGHIHGLMDGVHRLSTEATPEFIASQFRGLSASGSLRVRDLEVLDEAKRLVRQHLARRRPGLLERPRRPRGRRSAR